MKRSSTVRLSVPPSTGGFAAEHPTGRRYGSIAGAGAQQQRRPPCTAINSKCGQRHADSRRRRLNTRLVVLISTCAEIRLCSSAATVQFPSFEAVYRLEKFRPVTDYSRHFITREAMLAAVLAMAPCLYVTSRRSTEVVGTDRVARGTGRHLLGAANGRKLFLKIHVQIQIV